MLSFLIVIGAGHGIACLGILEVAGLVHRFGIGTKDFSLSLAASYDKSIAAASLFAFSGHLLLIISHLTKHDGQQFWTKTAGIIFLWISFYYLTHNLFADGLSEIAFITGLPFFIVSMILFYKIVKQNHETAEV